MDREREGQREQKLVGVYIDIYVYAVDLWSQRVCARFLCNRQQVELAERWQGSVTGSVAGSRSGRVAPGLLCYRCWPSLALLTEVLCEFAQLGQVVLVDSRFRA